MFTNHCGALAALLAFGMVPKAGAARLATIDDVLTGKITVDIELADRKVAAAKIEEQVKQTHEVSFPFRIVMVTRDLKEGGITQNARVRRFFQRDKSLAEVLSALVVDLDIIANVKSLADPNQLVVWVVAPDNASILITTRTAAQANSYKLPAVFRAER